MAEKFLAQVSKLMDDPALASVPKFPNNERVKAVNKMHKESVDEIGSIKVPDYKYYMSLLKKKAEELKDNTNNFQSRFNGLKSISDEISEARELTMKKEHSLRDSIEINNRLKDKYETETKRIQNFYKERQAKYNEFFDRRKAEIELVNKERGERAEHCSARAGNTEGTEREAGLLGCDVREGGGEEDKGVRGRLY